MVKSNGLVVISGLEDFGGDMERFNRRFLTACVALTVLVSLFGGCKKNSTGPENPESTLISESNLFPFVVGRMYVYSAYTLDTTGVKLPSSTHREATYIQGTATIGGKSSYRLIDSVYFTDGTFSYVDSSYFTVENGNLLTYQGAWITLFKPTAGIGAEYEGGSFTQTAFGIQVTVVVKCKISAKETVTTNVGAFQAYKLEVKTTATFTGTTYQVLQYVWFADGVGPIKQQEPPQVDPIAGLKATGSESLLLSKNF
jgi:hypothetical protein